MSDVKDWSTSSGANNDPAPNGFPEGMPPSGVNDASREVMAAIKRFYEQIGTERLVMGVPTYELDVIAPDAITADTIAVNSIAPNKLTQADGRRMIGTFGPDNDGLKNFSHMTYPEVKAILGITANSNALLSDVAGLGSLAFASSVGSTQIANTSINAAKLNYTFDDGNLTCWGNTGNSDHMVDQVGMSGGRFSFWPRTDVLNDPSGSNTERAFFGAGAVQNGAGPAAGNYISMQVFATGISQGDPSRGYVDTAFVNASAPWNMGHGDIGLFIWLRVQSDGSIDGASCSTAPPWGYNGPTSVVGERDSPIVNIDGNEIGTRKYKNIIDPDANIILPPWAGGDPTLWNDAAAEAYANADTVEIEIDQTVKNQDMDSLPHPWVGSKRTNETYVLIDPTCPLVDTLASMRKRRGELKVGQLFMDGHIVIGDLVSGYTTPNGVEVRCARWANS